MLYFYIEISRATTGNHGEPLYYFYGRLISNYFSLGGPRRFRGYDLLWYVRENWAVNFASNQTAICKHTCPPIDLLYYIKLCCRCHTSAVIQNISSYVVIIT